MAWALVCVVSSTEQGLSQRLSAPGSNTIILVCGVLGTGVVIECRGVGGVTHRNTGLIHPKRQPSESLVLAPGCPWRASGQLQASPSHRGGSRRGLSSTSVSLSLSISSVFVSYDAFPAQASLFIFASLRPGPGETFPVC